MLVILFQEQTDEQPSEFTKRPAVHPFPIPHLILIIHILLLILRQLAVPHLPVDKKLFGHGENEKLGARLAKHAAQPKRQGGDQNVSAGRAHQGGAPQGQQEAEQRGGHRAGRVSGRESAVAAPFEGVARQRGRHRLVGHVRTRHQSERGRAGHQKIAAESQADESVLRVDVRVHDVRRGQSDT